MTLTKRVKPISYVKANAARLVKQVAEDREPIVITQNGTATAVLQDLESFEATQDTMALLKILALGMKQVEAGRVHRARDVFRALRARRR